MHRPIAHGQRHEDRDHQPLQGDRCVGLISTSQRRRERSRCLEAAGREQPADRVARPVPGQERSAAAERRAP